MTEAQLTRLLANYRDINRALIERIKTFLHYWEGFKKNEHFEEKDITKRGFFTDNQLASIKEALKIKDARVREVVKDLLKSLENEKKDLDNLFKKNKHSELVITSQFETLMITYTHKQHDLIRTFDDLVPDILDKFDNMIGQKEVKIEDSQIKFVKLYQEIETALCEKYENLGVLYNAIYNCLEELSKFGGHHSELISENGVEKSSVNSRKFFSNYFRLNGHKIKFNDLKVAWTKSELDKEDVNYNSLKDTDDNKPKENIDTFMKGLLEELFNGITLKVENTEKDAKELIRSIIKLPTSLITVKKEFNDVYNNVSNLVHAQKYVFSANKRKIVTNIDELTIFFTNENNEEEKLTFKEFRKKYLTEDKKKLEIVSNVIRELANMSTDKEILNHFLKNQIAIEKSESKDSSNSDDDIWKDASTIDENKIVDEFNTLLTNISSIIPVVETTCLNENADLNNEQIRETLNNSKEEIIHILKIIGKNLKKYKDKNNESDNWYNLVKDSLKNTITSWNNSLNNKKDIKNVCEHTKNLISYFN